LNDEARSRHRNGPNGPNGANGQRGARLDYDATRLGALVAATLPQYDTVQDGVIETLRRAILLDVLPVGVRLRQEDLAGIFRTSRIPIREALRALEYEGLVRSEPHRGFAVAGLDGEQVEEIYELRTILEEHALRLAIPLLTERDISELDERYADVAAAIEGDDRVDGDEGIEIAIARLEAFYLRLYAVTARPRLVGLIVRLRQESVRSFRAWRIRPSMAHHKAFYDAVRSGDVEVAATAQRAHYVRIASLLRRFMRETGQDQRALVEGLAALVDEHAHPGRAVGALD
jgi:DNA-binding GntR family transcriptional regulator